MRTVCNDPEVKAVAFLPRDACDTLETTGTLHEKGRRMIADLVPGDLVIIFCGERFRLARVETFARPNPKCLVIEWTINLV